MDFGRLTKWEQAERGTIEALFFAGWCISGKPKWPKLTKVKDDFRAVFMEMYSQMGRRLRSLKTKKKGGGKHSHADDGNGSASGGHGGGENEKPLDGVVLKFSSSGGDALR